MSWYPPDLQRTQLLPLFRILICRAHALPPPYAGPVITQLSHNVTKDKTTVQLKCSGCTRWTTGSLNIQSTSADFIYSYSSNAPSNPAIASSSFTQHDDHGNFKLNLKSAQTVTATAPPPLSSTAPSTSGGLSSRQKVPYMAGRN